MAPELRPRKPAGKNKQVERPRRTGISWLTLQSASAAIQKPAPKPKPAPKRKAAEVAEDASPVAPKKTKATKADSAANKSTKSPKSPKPAAKVETPAEPEEPAEPAKPVEPVEAPEPMVQDDEAAVSEEENDQALALAGVSDNEDDGAPVDKSVAFKEGQDVGKAPKATKAVEEAAKAGKSGKEDTGVVYIGRIPHGFYEHEMRSYFTQFGDITRLRCVIHRRIQRASRLY
jgi:nucleolar protein 15